jgi:hypothetical protein
VVHVVVMVMVVMVMMMHRFGGRGGRSGGGASGCFLCDGVASEAEREHGGGGESLDHEKVFLWFKGNPGGSREP